MGCFAMFAKYELTIFLRAASIFAIVAGHFDFVSLGGGAYYLIALSGYNFMRFTFPKLGFVANRPETIDSYAFLKPYYGFVFKIFVPTFLYLCLVYIVLGKFYLSGLFLFSNFFGHEYTGGLSYWFIEVLLQIYVILSFFLISKSLKRLFVSNNYWFLFCASILCYVISLVCKQIWDTEYLYNRLPHLLIYMFFVGALCYCSNTIKKSTLTTILVTALCADQLLNNFGEMITLFYFGVVATIWIEEIYFPKILFRPINILAMSTLFIYLCHFQARSLLQKLVADPPSGLSVLFALIVGCVFASGWKNRSRLLIGFLRCIRFGAKG